jgi:hypothetical protein
MSSNGTVLLDASHMAQHAEMAQTALCLTIKLNWLCQSHKVRERHMTNENATTRNI